MKARIRITMRKSIKKTLKKVISSVTYTNVKVAGLIMQGLKKFWSDYQWVLALVALLYGIFLFYYQSTTSTPARIEAVERQFAEHIAKSEERFVRIENNQHNIDIALAELKIMMKNANEDLTIIKKSVVERQ